MLPLKQGFLFALIVLIVGNGSGFLIGRAIGVDLPSVCKKWNKNHVMEITLFITGYISFIIYSILPKQLIK